MSRDWFDPFGIRGSRLDPITLFTNALKGQGPTGQSAEIIAKTFARRLVGRTIHVDAGVPVSATIDVVDEARPPAPIAAVPTGVVEVPMWERVRVRLRDVEIGAWRLDHAALDVSDIRLVGASARAVRIGRVDFTATVKPEEVTRWAEAFAGDHRVRVHDGHLEVSDRRLARWAWVTIAVSARDQTVTVIPDAVRAFGKSATLPAKLRRPVRRAAPWLPEAVRIDGLDATGEEVIVSGHVAPTRLPIDVGRLLVDLGTEGTMSALRIGTGDR